MLMMKERRAATQNPTGLGDLRPARCHFIRECEKHGWVIDRADPHARERAIAAGREDPPSDLSPDEAVAAGQDVLDSVGGTCPECPSED
ncbi:hypothetical protein AYJ54_44745 [Bradyrhizobium centrolobii]|uniref:Uncharacterized protein n=1 Tax=Bradyrhizobium centrolobii TaxID=1505087 RepID=A0A176YZ94_9BRAD|nr:hypothetical protein [Bradyrhizobium centrolobii]OAF13095.1 hypothetical protein AYJ54_44745 [Bradyrhizobium centrolobii]